MDVHQDEESLEESSGDYKEEVEEGIGLGNCKDSFPANSIVKIQSITI